MSSLTVGDIDRAVEAALREDLDRGAAGDITTEAIIGNESGRAIVTANQAGVVAGLRIAQAVFARLDGALICDALVDEGGAAEAGQVVAKLYGPLRAILIGERTALNFLSRLSGIATLTAAFVAAAGRPAVKIYDTRKTTPGLRVLEKYAVTVGGGHNHRFGLSDGVLIKDNHIVGRGVKTAVELVKKKLPGRPVEVEVDTLVQLREALAAGADIVLLDNMDVETLKSAVEIAKDKVEIEISGGVSLENIGVIAAVGPARISVGALTQNAPPLDMSLTVIGA